MNENQRDNMLALAPFLNHIRKALCQNPLHVYDVYTVQIETEPPHHAVQDPTELPHQRKIRLSHAHQRRHFFQVTLPISF